MTTRSLKTIIGRRRVPRINSMSPGKKNVRESAILNGTEIGLCVVPIQRCEVTTRGDIVSAWLRRIGFTESALWNARRIVDDGRRRFQARDFKGLL